MSATKPLMITMGKRVSHRSHGNAGPVPGDIADATLHGKASFVRACETPEFFALFGCQHGRSREYVSGAGATRG